MTSRRAGLALATAFLVALPAAGQRPDRAARTVRGQVVLERPTEGRVRASI